MFAALINCTRIILGALRISHDLSNRLVSQKYHIGMLTADLYTREKSRGEERGGALCHQYQIGRQETPIGTGRHVVSGPTHTLSPLIPSPGHHCRVPLVSRGLRGRRKHSVSNRRDIYLAWDDKAAARKTRRQEPLATKLLRVARDCAWGRVRLRFYILTRF